MTKNSKEHTKMFSRENNNFNVNGHSHSLSQESWGSIPWVCSQLDTHWWVVWNLWVHCNSQWTQDLFELEMRPQQTWSFFLLPLCLLVNKSQTSFFLQDWVDLHFALGNSHTEFDWHSLSFDLTYACTPAQHLTYVQLILWQFYHQYQFDTNALDQWL